MPSDKFKDALWDDSDPDYAPFLKRIRKTYYWVPSKRYIDAGWAIKTFRLHEETLMSVLRTAGLSHAIW